jgi:hypothetical protein
MYLSQAFERAGRIVVFALVASAACRAQDLAPRAYTVTPVRSNAVTLSYVLSDGSVLFDPTLPITGVTGQIDSAVLNAYHSLSFFGRSANVNVALPYSFANFEGQVSQQSQSVYRSGLNDSVYRFSVNLRGGPAMQLKEFAQWRQKTLIGVSVKLVAPTGQYDPARLINQSTNRWSFKPELGVSRRWGRWVLDGYIGCWFFSANNSFYTGKNVQSQRPMGSFETHLSYDIKNRFWFSADGNYWFGGRSVVNGVVNLPSYQSNSRVGATASIPLTRYQSVKLSYSTGAYIIYGGDYRTISVAWQYSWVGMKFR